MRKLPYAVLLTGLGGLASVAHANGTPADLTWYGITLYGVIDVGASYQTHGSPLNAFYAQGLEYGISANSAHSYAGLAQNGLSQSRIGLKGTREFAQDWAGIFQVETRFSPLSGELANGPKSLIQNNGVPPALQTSNSDSSQAGQAFSSAAYAGVSSGTYGTLTLGRQYALLYDNILTYDPNGGSYAFSLIGFSALAAGGGNSEYNRLTNSVKYVNRIGAGRVGAQFQPSGTETGGRAYQLNLGGDVGKLSIDATYADKHVAVSLASYSPTPAQLASLLAKGLTLDNSLKATLSNTKSWSLMGRYDAGLLIAYAGYEHIAYANPDAGLNGLGVGSSTIGGYNIGQLSSTSYSHQRILQVSWAGAKVPITHKVTVTGAFYHYDQNSYATGSLADCSSHVASGCSGTENAYSLLLEYQLNKYADLYGGALRTAVSGGLSSGFVATASTSTTAGLRLSF